MEVEFYHPHTDNSKVWTRKTEFSLTTNTNSHEKIIDGKKKRVMCLMSDTGGGHRASAQALKDGFHTLYGSLGKLI